MQRALMMVLAVAMTAAYLALAVWGEGGVGPFLDKPPLVVLALLLALMALAACFTEGSLSAGEREDRANRWVIPAFAAIGLIDGWAPGWSDRVGYWVMAEGARWPGVVLVAAGGVLRLAPVFVLGRRFSGLVAIQKGHTLVTDGLYRTIRNPSYVGLLLMTLGWAMAFRAWIGVILTLLLLPPLVARMDSEERLLASQFGDEYAAYRAHTWRLIPWIY